MPKDRTKAQASVADASARRASAGPVLPRRLGWFSAVALSVLVAQPLAAQWTVTPLTPAGWEGSAAVGGNGTQQNGWVRNFDGSERAAVWSGTAGSFVNLHPAGASASECFGTDGIRQIGHMTFAGVRRAMLWNGSAASGIDLTPPGATASVGYGIDGDQQCGRAVFAGVTRAGTWNNTAASWVDLHPTGASHSEAFFTSGGKQVGYSQIGGVFRASLWSGSAASFVSLHPAGATFSVAFSTDASGNQQIGWATIGGTDRAGIWTGTAASWVSLQPPGAVSSQGLGVHAGYQVGHAEIAGVDRAVFWSGSAASWQDLSSLVSPNANGQARRIWVEGSTLYVAGFVQMPIVGTQAFLWSRLCPPVFTSQPAAAAVCPGGSTTMSVSANPANGPFTYQWQGEVNEVPGLWLSINDGELTGVATFAGTNTPTLTISGVTSSAGGRYRCIIRNTCGESPSDPATLTLCPADFNCSGGVDPDDLGDFINCYFDTPPCDRADFNADGNIDPDDLGDYINLFFGLPC